MPAQDAILPSGRAWGLEGMKAVMRRRLLVLTTLLACLVVLTTRATADSGAARVALLQGKAEVRGKGDSAYRPVRIGSVIRTGDRLRTVSDCRLEMQMDGCITVRLGPDSDCTIEELDSKGGTLLTMRARLQAGKAWAVVTRVLRVQPRLQVQTPSAVLAVRGTTLRLDVSERGDTEVFTYEGAVELQAAGQAIKVSREQRAAAAVGAPPEPATTFNVELDEQDPWVHWNKLRDRIKRAGDPRVMVVLKESNVRNVEPTSFAESELLRVLTEVGYRTVDSAQVTLAGNEQQRLLAAQGDAKSAQALAARFEADVLVVGSATSEPSGAVGGGLISSRATVQVKILLPDTGEVLASDSETSPALDVEQATAGKKALIAAGKALAPRVALRILEAIERKEKGFQIVVTRLERRSQMARVQERLTQLPGMKAVVLRQFVIGLARFDVDYEGSAEELAEALESLKDMRLTVIGISARKVEATYGR